MLKMKWKYHHCQSYQPSQWHVLIIYGYFFPEIAVTCVHTLHASECCLMLSTSKQQLVESIWVYCYLVQQKCKCKCHVNLCRWFPIHFYAKPKLQNWTRSGGATGYINQNIATQPFISQPRHWMTIDSMVVPFGLLHHAVLRGQRFYMMTKERKTQASQLGTGLDILSLYHSNGTSWMLNKSSKQ